MKKFVAFLMAFALCVACFGTYGFADISDAHNHVVHAVDEDDEPIIPEYLYINQKQTSYTFNELTGTLTLTLVIDSESVAKGKYGVLKVTAPYTLALGKPTVVGGSVFGQLAVTCSTVSTSSPTPSTTATSEVQFTIQTTGDATFSQYAYVEIRYPVDTKSAYAYSWLRQAQVYVSGTVVTDQNSSVGFDPSYSTYSIYICNHANTSYRVAKEATCLTSGVKERYCTVCNYVLDTEPILPTQHDLDYSKPFNQNLYPYVAPTCYSYGSGCFKCKDCESLISGSIPKLDHTFGERILENGVYYYICKVCNTREVATNQCPHDANAYTMLSVLKASTCTTKGTARYQCPTCKQIEERELPLADHTLTSSTITNNPTCTTNGMKTSTCTVCKQIIPEVMPALGHSYGEWTTVTPATCISNGVEARECVRCKVRETRTVNGTGHSYGGWITTVPASCTSLGTEVRTCALCKKTETQTIPLVAHTYGEWITTTPATCVASGVEAHTCVKCAAVETRAIAPIANNHQFSEWQTVVSKTCVTDGEKTRTCALCNTVETEKDACTGHVMGEAITEGKVTTKTCGVCGYKESIKTVKDGIEKTYSSVGGALVVTGTEASKNYAFEIGVPDMQTEAYYREHQNFYKAYTFKVLSDGTKVPMNDSMNLVLKTDAALEDYEISFLVLRDNAFWPVNEFERDDNEVIIPGSELVGADTIFVVRGEESSPNLVVPIIVTIVTLVVAGAAIYFFMIRGKQKNNF